MNKKHNIGDKVVALSSASRPCQPRKQGKIYTITNVYYCPRKGNQLVNIDNTKKISRLTRCSCGEIHSNMPNSSLTIAEEFVNINDIQDEIDNAVEIENYELAHVLHQIQTHQIEQ